MKKNYLLFIISIFSLSAIAQNDSIKKWTRNGDQLQYSGVIAHGVYSLCAVGLRQALF